MKEKRKRWETQIGGQTMYPRTRVREGERRGFEFLTFTRFLKHIKPVSSIVLFRNALTRL